jgi:hypothetical protein
VLDDGDLIYKERPEDEESSREGGVETFFMA